MTLDLLTSAQLANELGVTLRAVELWRLEGRGPTFTRCGRLVRYIRTDVVAWLESQRRTSTAA